MSFIDILYNNINNIIDFNFIFPYIYLSKAKQLSIETKKGK